MYPSIQKIDKECNRAEYSIFCSVMIGAVQQELKTIDEQLRCSEAKVLGLLHTCTMLCLANSWFLKI